MLPGDSPFTNEADLKELPYALDGSFTWLTNAPRHNEWAIGERSASKLRSQLGSLVASTKRRGLELPNEFVSFIGNPKLHEHLRSVTGCYLDVAESVLPFADGYLIRFLADQQECFFWYLYTNDDASDHCVVSSSEYCDADDMDDEMEDFKETDFYVVAESFEAFLLRFWLENEIWFSNSDSTPPPDVGPRFLELYTQ